MTTFWSANIMDYFDTRNISLQKTDIYARFWEYISLVKVPNLILFRNMGKRHYFGIELPHIVLFLRHGCDFIGYLFGG